MSSIWGPSVAENEKQPVKTFAMNLAQGAGVYDLCTASGGDVIVDLVHLYQAVGASGLTSVKLETDDSTVVTILSALEGLLANLVGGKNIKEYTTRFLLKSGKKLRYTIVGTGSAGTINATIRFTGTVGGATLI